jgi:hypothetical protein
MIASMPRRDNAVEVVECTSAIGMLEASLGQLVVLDGHAA